MMPMPESRSLDQLAATAAQGDLAAFRHIFDATYREVRLFAAARCSDQDLIDEVVQAAYVTAFERMSEYHGGGTLVSWLKGMARNRLLQEFERRRRLQPDDALALREENETTQYQGLGGKLARCLEQLAPTARLLIEQRYTQRMSVQKIAGLLNRSAGSVSVSLHRVRVALKECLGPEVVDEA